MLWDQENGSFNPCSPLCSPMTLGKLFKFCELSIPYLSVEVNVYALPQRVLPILPPQGYLPISKDISGYDNWKGAAGILWVEAGILLNTLQYIGWFPQQRILPPKIPAILRLRNPVL